MTTGTMYGIGYGLSRVVAMPHLAPARAIPYIGDVTPIRLRVREAREAQGMTQEALADAARIRRATLSAIERGLTKGIDFATLERLAGALEMDPALLIVRTK